MWNTVFIHLYRALPRPKAEGKLELPRFKDILKCFIELKTVGNWTYSYMR